MTADGYRGTLLGVMKIFWNQMPVMDPNFVNILKINELCTLQGSVCVI